MFLLPAVNFKAAWYVAFFMRNNNRKEQITMRRNSIVILY